MSFTPHRASEQERAPHRALRRREAYPHRRKFEEDSSESRSVSFAADDSFIPTASYVVPSSALLAADSLTINMPLLKRERIIKRPSNLVLLERKAWFLGRYLSRSVNEVSLAKLRSVIRLSKGIKTKLKLTSTGLVSGTKSSGLLRSKVPYEFAPLDDVVNILVDHQYPDVLLCVYRLAQTQLELAAYRMENHREAEIFRGTFKEMTSSPSSDVLVDTRRRDSANNNNFRLSYQSSNHNYDPYNSINSDEGRNWQLLKDKHSDYQVYTYPSDRRSHGNGNNVFMNGLLVRSPSPHQSSRSGSSTPEVVSTMTTSSMVTYRDVAVGAKISDPRDLDHTQKTRFFFDRPRLYFSEGIQVADVSCQAYVRPPRSSLSVTINPKLDFLGDDTISDPGPTWTGDAQMRKDLNSLQEEVRYLRSLLGTAGVYKHDLSDLKPNISSNGSHRGQTGGHVQSGKSNGQIVQSPGVTKIQAWDYRNQPGVKSANEHVITPHDIRITGIVETESIVEQMSLYDESVTAIPRTTAVVNSDQEGMTTSVRRLHNRPPSASRLSQKEQERITHPFQHPPVDKRRSKSADFALASKPRSSAKKKGQRGNDEPNTVRESRSRVKGNVKDHLNQNNPEKRNDYVLLLTHPARSSSASKYETQRGRLW